MTDSTPPTLDPTQRRELILGGEIDLHTAPDLERDGHAALAEPEVHALAVDLSAVTFIDSTGIGALVRLRLAAEGVGKQLLLVRPSSQVQRVLQVCALHDVFRIESAGSSA